MKVLREFFLHVLSANDVDVLVRRARSLLLTAYIGNEAIRTIRLKIAGVMALTIIAVTVAVTAVTVWRTPDSIIHVSPQFPQIPGESAYFLSVFIYFVIGVLIFFGTFASVFFAPGKFGRFEALETYVVLLWALCASLAVGCVFVVCVSAIKRPHALWFFLVEFGTGVASLMSMMLWSLAIIAALIILPFIRRIIYRTSPEAYLFDSLFSCFVEARNEKSWDRASLRRKMLGMLRSASEHLGDHLRATLMPDDPALASWWKTELKIRTAGILELKKWVLLPKSDTKQQFSDRLQILLLKMAQRDWDGMPTGLPQEHSRALWVERASRMIQNSLSAVLPFGIYFAIQRSRFAINAPYSEYLKILLFGWCVITLLISVDSSSRTKFEILRDLSQTIKFGKKE